MIEFLNLFKTCVGSWILVSLLLSINEVWKGEWLSDITNDRSLKTITTPNFRNRKILRFDRNNPINHVLVTKKSLLKKRF